MSATVSRGAVSKRSWTHEGRHRSAWTYTFKVDGRQVRRQGFLSRAEAQDALETAREQALHPEAPAAAPVAMTFGQAVTRYLAAKARKRSLAEDERITKHLTAEFGKDTPLTEMTAARIATYKAARLASRGGRLSAAAVNRPLALLRHLLRLACEEWGALTTVPVIRLEREPQGRLRWLTPPEATRLLEACRAQKNARLADLAEFCIYTGLRQSEALGLTWDRVDRARGVVLLELTKSGRRREVPLNGPADAVLARLGGGEGLVFGSRSWDAFRGA
jgi:integrase